MDLLRKEYDSGESLIWKIPESQGDEMADYASAADCYIDA